MYFSTNNSDIFFGLVCGRSFSYNKNTNFLNNLYFKKNSFNLSHFLNSNLFFLNFIAFKEFFYKKFKMEYYFFGNYYKEHYNCEILPIKEWEKFGEKREFFGLAFLIIGFICLVRQLLIQNFIFFGGEK